MRKSIVNGNGAICDICKYPLYPDETIKLKSFKLAGPTGEYKVLGNADLCELCYKKLLGKVMRKGREK